MVHTLLNTRTLSATVVMWTMSFAGCAKPDQVKTFETATPGLSFTEEISNGIGPATGDDTRVYARLDRTGKSRKIVVLSGEYVTLDQILWKTPTEATLCIQPGGLTEEFRNNIDLILSDSEDLKIHFSSERIANPAVLVRTGVV